MPECWRRSKIEPGCRPHNEPVIETGSLAAARLLSPMRWLIKKSVDTSEMAQIGIGGNSPDQIDSAAISSATFSTTSLSFETPANRSKAACWRRSTLSKKCPEAIKLFCTLLVFSKSSIATREFGTTVRRAKYAASVMLSSMYRTFASWLLQRRTTPRPTSG